MTTSQLMNPYGPSLLSVNLKHLKSDQGRKSMKLIIGKTGDNLCGIATTTASADICNFCIQFLGCWKNNNVYMYNIQQLYVTIIRNNYMLATICISELASISLTSYICHHASFIFLTSTCPCSNSPVSWKL